MAAPGAGVRLGGEFMRKVKPIFSSNEAEARQRVISLYKAWYRQIPYIVHEFDIPKSVRQCREKLKEEFVKNKDLKDVRIIDAKVIKGQMDLVETKKMWRQKHHVMNYFQDTRNKQPTDFLSKFYAGRE
ncbi:unnamed protein product [Darwinula stevensoni]|uniref:NADH dehydrogenase [ubiquinone] 1 alpha subcomplex subunit 6 n=1 Tax=Darwinula stevensoni TaxID=69355 RepID=A0A7R9ACP6_9CRUS|nr:unnamed protein product [Darwinula stevensoni]CAG0900592.1 unnamed protein product [Darwinula stevensoni]